MFGLKGITRAKWYQNKALSERKKKKKKKKKKKNQLPETITFE
jgi:hypothetical protein